MLISAMFGIIFLLLLFFFICMKKSMKKSVYFSALICLTVIVFFTSFSSHYGAENFTNAEKNLIQNKDDFPLADVIKIKDKIIIDVPVIQQMPELPRGCEVTSLAMLLSHAGIQVDKMILAEQVEKDPTPYKNINGKIYFGNPHDGFVGSMTSFNEPGLGVYHGPIAELAERYLPGRIINLTGSCFEELKIHLSDLRPVWVIINGAYKELPKSSFETWHTPSGTIEITYREHSVVLTGYDEHFVYFNDPLTGEKNKKAPYESFRDAWEQMGSQAITYINI